MEFEEVLTEFCRHNDEIIYLEDIYAMASGWDSDGWAFSIYCNLKQSENDEDIFRELHFDGQQALELYDKFRRLKSESE